MKFHFENHYTGDRHGYQKDAVESVRDLFCGQEGETNQRSVTEPLKVVVLRLF
jgi:hypothetical protein